jgi:uncharacterized protein YecE (DUF72 family)
VAQLICGTSGFAYPTWKPDFYPKEVPSKRFLQHYATRLNGVEINYSYHRLPSASTLEGWVEQTGPGFVFALKAHKRITHILRLTRSEFTQTFFQAIDPLWVQGRMGPVLFQLPPNLVCDLPKLQEFVADLPADVRCAFEFRHKSWLDDKVCDFLASRNIALCLAESEKLTTPERITADFVYFRLRKAEYTPADRAEIADKAKQLLAEGKDVYVFFKHEDTPEGALYAEEILKAAGQTG